MSKLFSFDDDSHTYSRDPEEDNFTMPINQIHQGLIKHKYFHLKKTLKEKR